MNRTWELCHLARPIPGVESGGRRQSVAEAPCKRGFDDAGGVGLAKDSSVARDGLPGLRCL